jgi:hypothetical protein
MPSRSRHTRRPRMDSVTISEGLASPPSIGCRGEGKYVDWSCGGADGGEVRVGEEAADEVRYSLRTPQRGCTGS